MAIESSAAAATFDVGPGRAYRTLAEVAPRLNPGDVVNLYGNATYGSVTLSKSGTKAAPIRIRGIRVNGARPVISGGNNTVDIAGDNNILEGLEIKGGSTRCVFNRAADTTIRDSVVHGCAKHGILGADGGSGSLTLSYVEVYDAGGGITQHPIYIATDEEAHPGSVFRMEHCYVHDNNGGNAVKSRAERNEIRYNWIDGVNHRTLELIGPDGQDEGLAREDSDVVGNVLRMTTPFYAIRVGGDGTGQTFGRYRFVNNTIIARSGAHAVFQAFDGVESIEMHNNVLYAADGGPVKVLRDDDADWVSGQIVTGSNNWMPAGSSAVPGKLTGTITGANPGFVSAGGSDYRLSPSSPLINKGTASTKSPAGRAFPSPLALPAMTPPLEELEELGGAAPRATSGSVDIGAYESEIYAASAK